MEIAPNEWCSKSSLTSDTNVDTAVLGEPIGWNPSGPTEGAGKWCATQGPAPGWNLKDFCPSVMAPFRDAAAAATQIKVLTYNLEWWENYQQFHPPNTLNPALGENIVVDDKIQHFDLMGFQECEDINVTMSSAKGSGLAGDWGTFGLHEGKSISIGMAWNKASFDLISSGKEYITEDVQGTDYYGKRAAQFVRLTHKASGAKVFFLNHHGATPVNTGGVCGKKATAYNILKTIANNAMKGDLIFMTCDCNAWSLFQPPNEPLSPWKYNEEIGTVACHLPHSFTSASKGAGDVWGIDNFFSNCAVPSKKGATVMNAGTIMGKGGSDHYALSLVYDLPGQSSVEEEGTIVA